MLTIKTDLENTNWLAYILEEFKRINKADFAIKITGLSNTDSVKNENVIYYTRQPKGAIALPNRSQIPAGREVSYRSNVIFVLDETTTHDKNFACDYDIFWNAFVFLSRLEEFLSETNGKMINGYSVNHARTNKDTFDIPVVNNLFNELENIIRAHFVDFTFGEKEKPNIELSHDVDYLEKTWQLQVKRTALNVRKMAGHIGNFSAFRKSAAATIHFLRSKSSYWNFDFWEELEKKYNKRSIFYLYAKFKSKGMRSLMLDPSYDVSRNRRLIDKLRYLVTEGFAVGLHGSYGSAVDGELLSKEKMVLEDALGSRVTQVRQHWLRYEENTTPYLHNKIFQFDSTLGWNDRMGFRSGCASKYRPYDHRAQKPFDFHEIPLVISDSNVFDYSAQAETSIGQAAGLLDKLQNYKSVHISLSWHLTAAGHDYHWDKAYEGLIARR